MTEERPTTTGDDGPDLMPVDVDGVRAIAIGTAVWAVVLVGLLPFVGTLRDDGHLWWLGTCAAGVVLGLAGLVYVVRRRDAIRRSRELRSGSDI